MNSNFIELYKEKYHLSLNIYSLFLLATFIPDYTGVNSSFVTNTYWLIKLFLAILIIVTERRSLFNLQKLEILFIAISIAYSINIFNDVYFADPPSFALRKEFTGSADFIGFVVGIVISISFRYNALYFSSYSFKFFCSTLFIGLLVSYFVSIENINLDVHNVRYDANSTINSIMYGQMGCALALVSVYGIINNKNIRIKLLFFILLILGFISIIKASSRSPIFVFFIVTLFYLIARLGKIKALLIILIGLFMAFFIISFYIKSSSLMNNNLVIRLSSMYYEKETSGRDNIYENVLNLIYNDLFLGSYYLVKSGPGAGLYPHNYFLEVFMANGLIIGILFLALITISLKKSYFILRYSKPESWVIILYLQVLTYGMFSTGLYTSQEFWILLFFTISIPKKKSKHFSNTYQYRIYENHNHVLS